MSGRHLNNLTFSNRGDPSGRGINRGMSDLSMNIDGSSMSREPSNRSTLDGSADNDADVDIDGDNNGNVNLSRRPAPNSIAGGSTARSISERINRHETIVKPNGPGGSSVNNFRFMCGKCINHPMSEQFITFIIFCNTVLLVLSTFDFYLNSQQIVRILDNVDYIFLAIFTVESILQLIYHDIKIFKNRWLTFDLLLVIVSWVFSEFTVLRCLRILKIASKFEALQRLITALLDVIPNITAIFSLLLLVFYIFAVMFTTLFKDLDLEIDYFSRLDKTLFSLFQFMTMDWQEAARDCAQFIPWAPLLFVLFEIVSGFIVFNLIVAVLCEALGLLEKDTSEDELHLQIEKERIDAMNSLLERVEMIKKHQLKIQQTLREISGDKKSS